MLRCGFLLLAMTMACGLSGCLGSASLQGTVDGKQVDLNFQSAMMPGFGQIIPAGNGGGAAAAAPAAPAAGGDVDVQNAGTAQVDEGGDEPADVKAADSAENLPALVDGEELVKAGGDFAAAADDEAKDDAGGGDAAPEDFDPVGGGDGQTGAEDFEPVGAEAQGL